MDGVALRLRLPAKQALCADAMPICMRMFPSPRLVRGWGAAQPQKRQNPSKLAEITLLSFLSIFHFQTAPRACRQPRGGRARHSVYAAPATNVCKWWHGPPWQDPCVSPWPDWERPSGERGERGEPKKSKKRVAPQGANGNMRARFTQNGSGGKNNH